MNKITARDLRMFIAGALALDGFQALLMIPYYFASTASFIRIVGAAMAGLALPIGVGIFMGRWSAYFCAQVYLWLKLILGCTAIFVFWQFSHEKIRSLAMRSAPEILATAVLLGLVFWTTSEKFRYEPDA